MFPVNIYSVLNSFALSNFIVWVSAFWNQHYMVAFATLLVLLALVFQPLAAAMFTVRDTYLPHPSQYLDH
jgi:hypothetical protein